MRRWSGGGEMVVVAEAGIKLEVLVRKLAFIVSWNPEFS